MRSAAPFPPSGGAFLAFAAVLLVAMADVAAGSFGCETQWAGANAQNVITVGGSVNPTTCNVDKTYLAAAKIAPIFLPLIVLAFALVLYPITFVLRLCCNLCGSHRRRPGAGCFGGSEWDTATEEEKNKEYNEKFGSEVRRVKVYPWLLWIFAAVCLILMVVGTTKLATGADKAVQALTNLVDYMDGQLKSTISTVTTASGGYVNYIDNSMFTKTMASIDAADNAVRSEAVTISNLIAYAEQVGYGLGLAPCFLFALMTAFSAFDIRRCWPALMTAVNFFFLIVLCLLSAAVFTLAIVTDDVCDEMARQRHRAPGVGQWLVVPKCQVGLTFGGVISSFSNASRVNNLDTCNALLNICDNSPSSTPFDPTFPNKVYNCPGLFAASASCATTAAATNTLATVVLKPGQASPCSGASAACTPALCATLCAVGSARQVQSAIAVGRNNAAQRIDTAVTNFLTPLTDCNNLAGYIAGLFSDDTCKNLKDGGYLFAVGAWFYGMDFALGILVMFWGQKRFFKQPSEIKPTVPTEPTKS